MKAAAVAAERGHRVRLYERAPRLGGQALLAQQLPGREEFGGLVTNLTRELEAGRCRAGHGGRGDGGADRNGGARRGDPGDRRPALPAGDPRRRGGPGGDGLGGHRRPGPARANSVVIADWRGDWIGLGLAEMLAKSGRRVRLCANGSLIGEALQLYTRNHYVARLRRLGVEQRTYLRLYGVDADTAYFPGHADRRGGLAGGDRQPGLGPRPQRRGRPRGGPRWLWRCALSCRRLQDAADRRGGGARGPRGRARRSGRFNEVWR